MIGLPSVLYSSLFSFHIKLWALFHCVLQLYYFFLFLSLKVKILPLGDSIAAGFGCTCGWRDELKLNLAEYGVDVIFEGTVDGSAQASQNCPIGYQFLDIYIYISDYKKNHTGTHGEAFE